MIVHERTIGSHDYRFVWWGLRNWRLGAWYMGGERHLDVGPFSISRYDNGTDFGRIFKLSS